MFNLLATPLVITFVQWQNLILITFKLCAKYFVYTHIDDVYKDINDVFANVTLCTGSSLHFYYSLHPTCLYTVLCIIYRLSDNIITS